MNISLSGILFLVSCILIASTIIGIILFRLSSGGNMSTEDEDYEMSSIPQKRKRMAAKKAVDEYLSIQKERADLKIRYNHKLSKRREVEGEVSHAGIGYTGKGKQKITA